MYGKAASAETKEFTEVPYRQGSKIDRELRLWKWTQNQRKGGVMQRSWWA